MKMRNFLLRTLLNIILLPVVYTIVISLLFILEPELDSLEFLIIFISIISLCVIIYFNAFVNKFQSLKLPFNIWIISCIFSLIFFSIIAYIAVDMRENRFIDNIGWGIAFAMISSLVLLIIFIIILIANIIRVIIKKS